MTAAGEFTSAASEELEVTPNYPTAFGVTLTPPVTGLLVGILGLSAGIYLLITLLQPAWESYQQLRASVEDKRLQLEQRETRLQNLNVAEAELREAQQQRVAVQSLFAGEISLDTLLLDFNRLVTASQIQLMKYEPNPSASGVVQDDSLGSGVNGKLQRQSIAVAVEGDFNQIQLLLRDLERLQPLVLVEEMKLQRGGEGQTLVVDPQGRILVGEQSQPPLEAAWTMQAITALSPETIAAIEAKKQQEAEANQEQEAEDTPEGQQ